MEGTIKVHFWITCHHRHQFYSAGWALIYSWNMRNTTNKERNKLNMHKQVSRHKKAAETQNTQQMVNILSFTEKKY